MKLNARRSAHGIRRSEGQNLGRDHGLLQHDLDRSHFSVARREGAADPRTSERADRTAKERNQVEFPDDSVAERLQSRLDFGIRPDQYPCFCWAFLDFDNLVA